MIMKDIDKLEMYRNRQFQCLLFIVQEWINDWSIWKNNSLYKLFLKNEKLEKKALERILTK